MTHQLRRRRPAFAPVPEALLFDPNLSSHAKVVWGVLDRRIDNRPDSDTEGCAFPGREWIAETMGVSTDTVDRALKALEEAGWILVERPKGGRRNVYELLDHPEPPPQVRTGADRYAAPVRSSYTARVRTTKEREQYNESNERTPLSPRVHSTGHPKKPGARQVDVARAEMVAEALADRELDRGMSEHPVDKPAAYRHGIVKRWLSSQELAAVLALHPQAPDDELVRAALDQLLPLTAREREMHRALSSLCRRCEGQGVYEVAGGAYAQCDPHDYSLDASA